MTFEEWKRKKHEESCGLSYWAKIPDEYLHPREYDNSSFDYTYYDDYDD
jgi:hypothetical protein